MNNAAVFHQMSVLDASMYNDRQALIKIRTAQNDMASVTLHYRDKYKDSPGVEEGGSVEMIKVAHDSVFDYYEALMPSEVVVMKYYFELKDCEGKVQFFGATEFYNHGISDNDRMYDYPRRAREEDAFMVPDWVEDAIVYQIFPERFHKGPDQVHDSSWYGKVKWDSHLGGSLDGITYKLDYLEELGINVIYMTPVFESPSNHKYNTTDYYSIDQNFGSKEAFRKLIDQAHKKGMKVIIDGVFNHSGDTFEPFEDLKKKGESSKYKDWFLYEKLPIRKGRPRKTGPNYDAFAYHAPMPKLNTKNQELTDYLLEAVAYWTSEFDIDGWRLDVADEVAHEFWRAFRKVVKGINPDALIVGEVWYDSAEWLRGDEFDTVMNYKFQTPTIDWIANEVISVTEFSNRINQVRGIYPYTCYKALWNLLDSHDTARFLRVCGEDKDKLKLAALLQMTFTGSPFIYYGTEVGMTGGEDPDCRRGMLWDSDKQDRELFAYYKHLITIRKAHRALRAGELEEVLVDDQRDLFIFDKVLGDDRLTVVLNNSKTRVDLPEYVGRKDLVSGTSFDGRLDGKSGLILG